MGEKQLAGELALELAEGGVGDEVLDAEGED